MTLRAEEKQDVRVRRKVWRFRASLLTFAVMLLLSGMHFGLIVLVNRLELQKPVQVLIPTLYWALMAASFTVVTNRQIRSSYDGPMRTLGQAAREVAAGDFSIYLKPRHTENQLDYIDAMYLDFNTMVEALGSMETMKTEFFSNVSHEMKAPLAVLQSSLELMGSGRLTEEEMAAQLRTALSAARRMNDLIGNLLKLNKLENQTIIPKPDSYDVCEQLCQSALAYESLWEEKDLDFEAELDDAAWVMADADLMRMVWNNLLSNAVKFTEPGGRIELRQTLQDGAVLVSVADTGCGMDEQTCQHIFEKFYQGDTSHGTEGNGLGLALVQRILQLTGGTITVQSSPGAGSVFTVRLPAGQAPGTDGQNGEE